MVGKLAGDVHELLGLRVPSGCRMTALTTEKMAVFAPMPSASVRIDDDRERPAPAASARTAWRTSPKELHAELRRQHGRERCQDRTRMLTDAWSVRCGRAAVKLPRSCATGAAPSKRRRRRPLRSASALKEPPGIDRIQS